ncbi:hypothetical protein Taro_025611 [Colocasia esculenta]|uniref:Uncharacterized protein n=1 Tax=Colocasia esculenta TaxID=4460 RepID=A0A843VCR0_COLES|nr:hypothetical protein [Colocasia esculenta]
MSLVRREEAIPVSVGNFPWPLAEDQGGYPASVGVASEKGEIPAGAFGREVFMTVGLSAEKRPAAASGGLRAEDIDPRLVFHYGVPAGSNSLAYDPIQKIIAIATTDGRIKLFGTGNTQALLESVDATPSKFLQHAIFLH